MPNVMVALPNIGGASVQHRRVSLTPTTRCRAETLPRRETHWNFQGCPKLANRSQLLVREVRHIMRICGEHIAA